MRKINKFIFSIFLCLMLLFITSCNGFPKPQSGTGEVQEKSVITIESELPSTMETTTEKINFNKYFKIIDSVKGSIEVLDEYFDLSNVDPYKPGTYIIKIKYLNVSKTFTITFTGKDKTPHPEYITLNTPSIKNVTNRYLNITISFSNVSYCSKYLIKIYNESNIMIDSFEVSGTSVNYSLEEEGNYSVSIQALSTIQGYNDSKESNKYSFTVNKKPEGTYVPERDLNYTPRLQEKYAKDSNYFGVGIPSLGKPKVLVVPVDFSNTTYTSQQIETIKKAFIGTEVDTGYESLNSYYKKASYGKLDIQVDFLPTYKFNKTASSFERNFSNYDEVDLLDTILNYYNYDVDYSDYDYNNDGRIDGIYMIYNYAVDYDGGETFWAWCAWAEEYGYDTVRDGVIANYYNWTSYYFFNEWVPKYSGSSVDVNGDSAVDGLKINATTIIHETGHMLGLDDYYDYSTTKGVNGGLGGFDMMDYNEGDHCSYSKIMMGWINPYIVTDSCSIELNSFGSTGDSIIIPKDPTNPYFGEYLTIEYSTPDGLNRLHNGYTFTIDGIKLMQVDSTLPTSYNSSQFSFTKYDNSEAQHALIRYIEPDGKFQIQKSNSLHTYDASNNTLFKAGGSFTPGVSNTIWSQMKWYDGSAMNFSIHVQSIQNDTATILIEFR